MGTPNAEEAAECPSPLELQIIKQIEYYFGNYNLNRDRYLREELKKDDGWVPLENMVKFNRLKKLSEDFKVIGDALKKSPKQLMEVNEDCTKIRRRSAPNFSEDPTERTAELDERTLYMKGFQKTASLDDLLEFFKEYQVEHVFMRRMFKVKNKPFKGSAFITFETKEDAEKILDTKGFKYKEVELLKEFKKDYLKRKDEEYRVRNEERANKRAKKAAAGLNEDVKEEVKDEVKEEEDDSENPNMVRGCLLKLSNLEGDCNREKIKAAFEPFGTVVYADYHFGKPSGVIRFDTAIANDVLEKINEEDGERKIDIGTSKAVVTAIEGDEETEYWKFISKSRIITRQRLDNQHKFGGNRGFGNRGRFKKWGKRGRRNRGDAENEDDTEVKNEDKTSEPPAKKLKSESTVKEESTSEDQTVNKTDKISEPPAKKLKSESTEEKDVKKTEVNVEVKTDS